jgi:hypothetical protein
MADFLVRLAMNTMIYTDPNAPFSRSDTWGSNFSCLLCDLLAFVWM